jgi:hypothetical protein
MLRSGVFLKGIYEGRDIDLKAVKESVENFLHSKGFTFNSNEIDDKVRIEGFCPIESSHKVFVRVTLEKRGDKFIIDFETPIEKDPLLRLPGFLTMCGLGFIFRKKAELYDFYERLELEFWRYIDGVCLGGKLP